MPATQDPITQEFTAVCIRCGHQGRGAGSCTACGGAVILTRQSQAVRESNPDLLRVPLPGIDEPKRLARGTLPPGEPRTPALVALPAAAAVAVPRGRAILTAALTLVSAGLIGLVAAAIQASL